MIKKKITTKGLSSNSKGFTILELLIATAVFSVVLLLCATAIVQVGRAFYKGTIVNNTQNTARSIINDISQAIQFGGGNATDFYKPPVTGSTSQAMCVGDIRYSYILKTKSLGSTAAQSPHVLWKDRLGSGVACTPLDVTLPDPGGIKGQELLGSNMRLSVFTITKPTGTGAGWTVSITVALGATDDLFTNANNDTCISDKLGGQFCAVSAITTHVIRRL